MKSEEISNNQDKPTDIQDDVKNFQFLDDYPIESTNEDSFGCHKRVAESIARQIESDPKSKTIGLEGTWGSGKSSVIKMLEDRWSKGEYKNENIKLFTYDA